METEARDEREQWREREGLKAAFLLTTRRRSKGVTRNENRLKFETHIGVFSLATEGGDGVVPGGTGPADSHPVNAPGALSTEKSSTHLCVGEAKMGRRNILVRGEP